MILKFIVFLTALIITINPAQAGDFSGGVHDPIFEFTSFQVSDSTPHHLLFFKLDEITSLNISISMSPENLDNSIFYMYDADVNLTNTNGYANNIWFRLGFNQSDYFYGLLAGDYTYDITTSNIFKSGSISIQSSVCEVPEPETYATMLAGLSAFGFFARRRKSL